MNFSAMRRLAGAAGAMLLLGTAGSAQPAPPAEIAAPAGAGATFGRSVAIDGTTLVVGAPGESTAAADAGAAYVFELRESGWTLVARLAPDVLAGGDEFGYAVAIDSNIIVVGAPGDDGVRSASGSIVSTVPNKGAAYVYERRSGTWSLAARLDQHGVDGTTAQPIAAAEGDRFGHAVGAGDDVVMVGAPWNDAPWSGSSIADNGVLAVFERGAGTWRLTDQLRLRELGRPSRDARLGASIALRDQVGLVASGTGYVTLVQRSQSGVQAWAFTGGGFMGNGGNEPWRDGVGLNARMVKVTGILPTGTGAVLNDSSRIRSVTPGGVVSTTAVLTLDEARVFESAETFVTAVNGKQLFRGDLTGALTFVAGNATFGLVDGTGTSAGFGAISAIAPDGLGNYYVADLAAIRKVTSAGVVTTVAGVPTVIGSTDGPAGVGQLGAARSLIYDQGTQKLYIADRASVRVMAADGTLSTLAGVPGSPGTTDGAGPAARFQAPHSLTLASDGSLLLLDGARLRRVSSSGEVTSVIAASTDARMVDGPVAVARLAAPTALAAAADGSVFVADRTAVRLLTPALELRTIAGIDTKALGAAGTSVALGVDVFAVGDPAAAAPFRAVDSFEGAAWVVSRDAFAEGAAVPAFPPAGALNFASALAFSQDTLFASDVDPAATAGRAVSALTFAVDRWSPRYDVQPADLSAHPLFGASLAGAARLLAVGSPGTVEGTPRDGAVFVFDIDTVDADGDGLPDGWERRFGLDPSSNAAANGATGDPDGDGATNAAELAAQTHPRSLAGATRFFAEGARSAFFATQFSIANATASPANVLLRRAGPDGTVVATPVSVPARASRHVAVPLDEIAEFATRIETDTPVAVDRIMSWRADAPYGTHGERGLESASTIWYFAEGATHSGFDLFYLLYNPSDQPASVRVRYLRGSGGPVEKLYEVGPGQRFNVWVDLETFDGQALLAAADVSARIEVVNDVPIIAERAMYRTPPDVPASAPGALFTAGHESAGVVAPAASWFFAEGATSDFFDLFVLIANPHDDATTVRARFLLGDGRTLTKDYVVAGNSRFNIWVDRETFDGMAGMPLANVGEVSTALEVVAGPPIVAERAMWWPGPTAATWTEAHGSAGATVTASRWVAAAGDLTASNGANETYYLLANPGSTAASVTVTLLFDNGRAQASRTFTVAAGSRFTVNVRAEFASAAFERFSAVFETAPTTPIVVEWAIYRDANGQPWVAGASGLATPLP